MATEHRLQLTYDTKTGDLTVAHRTIVGLAGHEVSYAEPLELDPASAEQVKAAMKAMIDGNGEEMAKRATESTIQHISAVTKTPTKKNTQQLTLRGSLGKIQTSSDNVKK